MLYELLYGLSEHATVFNLLRYITFRSIAGFFTAFLLGILIAPMFIKWLKSIKIGQEIRECGPESHMAKQGTPTMGGLFIILASLVSVLLWARFNYYVLTVTLALVMFGSIGFLDDYLKVSKKNSKGASAKLKIVFQLFASGVIIALLYFNPDRNPEPESYKLCIKDEANLIVREIELGKEATGSYYWEGRDAGEYFVASGTYRMDIIVSDTAGNQIEETLTTLDWSADDQYVKIDLSESATENEEESLLARDYTLTYFAFDLESVSSESGTLTLPLPADLFASFYVPYYSQPVWNWPTWLAVLFYLFVLVAFSNATNLSDGLDGLAAGMSIILYIPFGIFAYVMGNVFASSYLLFPYIDGAGEICIILASMIGGFTAFLWHNVHPAHIFMGDTGSLAIGGTIATAAIILKMELILAIAGMVFVMEALSVVLQVFWYKKTKKRLFKMAPIHHHFELKGWAETQVVPRFWIMSALFALIALSALKIR